MFPLFPRVSSKRKQVFPRNRLLSTKQHRFKLCFLVSSCFPVSTKALAYARHNNIKHHENQHPILNYSHDNAQGTALPNILKGNRQDAHGNENNNQKA